MKTEKFPEHMGDKERKDYLQLHHMQMESPSKTLSKP